MGEFDRDRNLLFGVLAVQLRKLDPAQLVELAAAWATGPSRGISERAAERGLITDRDKRLLDGLVDQAIAAHDGDVTATLTTFGGMEEVDRSFCGSLTVTGNGDVEFTSAPTKSVIEKRAINLSSITAVDESPGRYTHPRERARGGLGRILLVHDESLGREIALKELLPSNEGADKNGEPTPVRQAVPLVARFLQEARITGQLEHPSIVPVYELGRRRDGSVYYTMKLVRGRTLSSAIKAAGSLEERLKLLPHFVDLCQAIAYAHSRGVIHRDIKPSNVMVGEFGETVVIDWGLAKSVDKPDIHAEELEKSVRLMRLGEEADLARTSYGEVLGTPVYMSPEQARGEIASIDQRSDVYALGAVLYRLLAGEPPVQGSSLPEILREVCEVEPKPVLEKNKETPPELDAICRRALSKDKNSRFQSAAEFANEVQRFLEGSVVKTYRYGLFELVKKKAKKHKGVTIVAAIAVLLLFAMGFLFLSQLAEEQEKTANEFYRASIGYAEKLINEMRFDDARKLLFGSPENLRGWEWGRLQYLINRDLMSFPLPEHTFALSIHLSPNRRNLWVYGGESKGNTEHRESAWVFSYDLVKGTQMDRQAVQSSYWSKFSNDKDDIPIFAEVAENDRSFSVINLATKKRISHYSVPEEEGNIVRFAFGKHANLFAAALDNRVVIVGETQSAHTIYRFEMNEGSPMSLDFSRDGKLVVAGDNHGRIFCWNVDRGQPVFQIVPFKKTSAITVVAVSPDSRYVCGGGWDGFGCWAIPSGRPLMPLSSIAVSQLKILESGDIFSAGLLNQGLKRLRIENGQAKVIQEFPGSLFDISEDGNVLTTNGFHSSYRDSFDSVFLWATDKPGAEIAFGPHDDNRVASVALSPDLKMLATGTRVGSLTIWDANTGHQITSVTTDGPGHSGWGVSDVAFSPDSNYIVSPCGATDACIWAVPSLSLVTRLSGHTEPVLTVDWNSDGDTVATGGEDGYAIIWDVKSGENLLMMRTNMITQPQNHTVTSVRFSPVGNTLLTAEGRGPTRVWDLETGTLLHSLNEYDIGGTGKQVISISADKKHAVANGVGPNRQIVLFDLTEATTAKVLEDVESNYAIALGPETRRMAMAPILQAGPIEILDLDRQDALLRLIFHRAIVSSIKFSNESNFLVSSSRDSYAVVWPTFPWHKEDYPGDSSMSFDERVELFKRQFWRDWFGDDYPLPLKQ